MSLVRRVTLTKAQRSTAAGQELIGLLVDLSEDGMVTREEMERLRAWLEVDRGIDFAACPFLYEIVDQIASDGEITEEELDQLALGIERVLPSDVRVAASRRRRELREAKKREVMERRARERVDRDQMRARLSAARQHAKPLHRTDYWVAGACRSEERREACEKVVVGDTVDLEREPDNRHDENAILILSVEGDTLGYVPRGEAAQMAPLLDTGAEYEATIKRIWERDDGNIVPIVVSVLRHSGARQALDGLRSQLPAIKPVIRRTAAKSTQSSAAPPPAAVDAQDSPATATRGGGCLTACLFLILALAAAIALLV